MYVLILTLFLFEDGGRAGQGGASVAVEKFATEDECYIARNAFLSMRVTSAELTGGEYHSTRVSRKGECISLVGRAYPATSSK